MLVQFLKRYKIVHFNSLNEVVGMDRRFLLMIFPTITNEITIYYLPNKSIVHRIDFNSMNCIHKI